MSTKMQDDQHGAPPLVLERAAAGELGAEQQARLTEADRARVAELEEDNEAQLRAYPPNLAVAAIQRKLDDKRSGARARRNFGLALVPACAVALLTLMPSTDPDPVGVTVPTERTKGPPLLQVFRQTEEGEQRLGAGASAAPGDLLQLRYDARGKKYGVIVSLDGAGVVTPHLPERLSGPAATLQRALVTLPTAYELDDAPRFERFFIVTSPTPFEVEAVVEAIRATTRDPGARLELPDELSQADLHLNKDAI